MSTPRKPFHVRRPAYTRSRSSANVDRSDSTDAGNVATTYTRPQTFSLGKTGRSAVLVVHIVSAGAWIGIDVIVGVLVLSGWLTADPVISGLAYQALGTFAVAPMLASGLVCLASGALLGVGTRYGLVRYWWVAVKLVMNLVLSLLIVFALQPGMTAVVEHGRALAAGQASTLDVTNLFFPPLVSLTVLTVATVLSVFKPWGRIRSERR